MSGRSTAVGLLAGLFAIGFVLMGYEMLGSRYLNPYFGGGITTWACLISVVLLGMMGGYFAGGYAVDTWPGVGLLAVCSALAGLYIITVPLYADATFGWIVDNLGDRFLGALSASVVIAFLPVGLFSACSPFVVRLLLDDLKAGGRVTGWVYSISTFGNVLGTLVTTFYMIPSFGTRTITYMLGGAACAIALFFLVLGRQARARNLTLAALLLVPVLTGTADHAAAAKPERSIDAAYPEGALWIGETLYYAEMTRDRVSTLVGGNRRTLWEQRDCGPTAISRFGKADYLVLCHLAGKVVHISSEGKLVHEYTGTAEGERFRDPNDCHEDGQGGVFFSDPGPFARALPASGKVFHISADGTIHKLAEGLHYANGVAFDTATKELLVSEHLAGRVWRYTLTDTLASKSRALFLDLNPYLPKPPGLIGPDGIEIDKAGGRVLIAVYGGSMVLTVDKGGKVSRWRAPMTFVTNVATSAEKVAIVGAYTNDQPPFYGRVDVLSRAQFSAELEITRPGR